MWGGGERAEGRRQTSGAGHLRKRPAASPPPMPAHPGSIINCLLDRVKGIEHVILQGGSG